MAKGREELRSAFLNKKSSFISKLTRALWISSLAMMMSPLMIQKSFAATSTWSALPADNDWNNVGNWSAGVPTDVAEFNFSPITSLDLTAVTPGVNQIVFNVAATDPQYTINTSGFTLDISNTGITNNSAVVQTFNVNGGSLRFNTTASASTGSSNVSIINGNLLEFRDTSTASTATITNNFVLAFSNSSTANAANITNNPGSELAFNTDSTAGSATITNSGNTNFFNSSKAGTSHITNNLSHFLDFFDTSTAEGSTITNNGTTEFLIHPLLVPQPSPIMVH
jgi:hypothetical protein